MGARNSPLFMPNSSAGDSLKSSSFSRWLSSGRSTRLVKTSLQLTLSSSASIWAALMPLAYRPPTIAPIEVPEITSIGMRSRSRILSTPT